MGSVVLKLFDSLMSSGITEAISLVP